MSSNDNLPRTNVDANVQKNNDQSKVKSDRYCRIPQKSPTSSSSATSSSNTVDNFHQSQGRKCGRCGAPFGRFFNTGAACPRCKNRVCRQCRKQLIQNFGVVANNNRQANTPDWLCAVCNRIADLRSVSGEWMIEGSNLRRNTDNSLSPLDILKCSIRRAWTINGPPARWSVERKSVEFRLYRSLPVRRDYNRILDEENNAKNLERDKNHHQHQQHQHQNERPRKPSLIRAPKILSKLKNSSGDSGKKSSIPVFRNRSSKEFEDIRSPQESPKRSLIPQRYRASTDDLRRSREDISTTSFIPKLLSPTRNKEEKSLKRSDISKDDNNASRSSSRLSTPVKRDLKEDGGKLVFNKQRELIFNNKSNECNNDCNNLQVKNNLSDREMRDAREKMLSDLSQDNEIKEKRKIYEKLNLRVTKSSISDLVLSKEIIKEQNHEVNEDGNKVLEKNEASLVNVDENDEADTAVLKNAERQKIIENLTIGKKVDENAVIRRKFSKEESSNADDTDDTLNRRCSSHLSPEASPLSTRSSRYSPRESESEPTPALPRKIGSNESTSASQRIRDAISRTRRESNSSARYESSGSESVRLGDQIPTYVELSRRVKFLGSGGLIPSGDEILHRDSATSAGEDEPHNEYSRDPSRLGTNSQSRVMFRRRRQFDAQGTRRRGRTQGLQALHVLGRSSSGTQQVRNNASPPESLSRINLQDGSSSSSSLLDYRRLVFISSDSSSGREEDDADSSCSGSSYLNGIQQTSEDCDWDYFESGTLPLPLQFHNLSNSPHIIDSSSNEKGQDWSCCPAKGASSSCQACGGTRNTNVLPVPVPIPVPVPYPVPVPASMWNSDIAAAASSMITNKNSTNGSQPSWLANWQPPKFVLYSNRAVLQHHNHNENTTTAILSEDSSNISKMPRNGQSIVDNEKIIKIVDEKKKESLQYNRLPNCPVDSRSSSGRSSADSSDLEDSASHSRFNKILVLNDDSLTSEDNDVEDNEDSDSTKETGNQKIADLPQDDEQPVVLQRIRVLDEDYLEKSNINDISSKDVEEQHEDKSLENEYCITDEQNNESINNPQIPSYSEIYLASIEENRNENCIFLKSVKSIDPDTFEATTSKFSFDNNLNYTDDDDDEVDRDDDTSNDSAVMPDSLEVSVHDLEDSIEIHSIEQKQHQQQQREEFLEEEKEKYDQGGINLTLSKEEEEEVVEKSTDERTQVKKVNEEKEERQSVVASCERTSSLLKNEEGNFVCTGSSISSGGSLLFNSKNNKTGSSIKLKTHDDDSCVITPPTCKDKVFNDKKMSEIQSQQQQLPQMQLANNGNAGKSSRKRWQIPSNFDDFKVIPSSVFTQPEKKKKESSMNPLLSAIRGEDNIANESNQDVEIIEEKVLSSEKGEKIIDEISVIKNNKNTDSVTTLSSAHDESATARGVEQQSQCNSPILKQQEQQQENQKQQSQQQVGGGEIGNYVHLNNERCAPALSECNGPSRTGRNNWCNSDSNKSGLGNIANNRYRSLVMITQGAYQPVNVVTSDTTTLLQPQFTDNNQQKSYCITSSGLQPVRRTYLPCRKLTTNSEQEIDSGLSVGSASESDEISNNGVKKIVRQTSCQAVIKPDTDNEDEEEDSSSHDVPRTCGPLILEEGLADDDSWVEEISHDEDDQSNTTATEESSEDEANNVGDREEELRGYNRPKIDFSLHTIVEESCEESEPEHCASWRRRSPGKTTVSDLEKYFFFGLGGNGNNKGRSEELDSLSETSSILSEGLESLGKDDKVQDTKQEKTSGDFNNSTRHDKNDNIEQGWRDSDGSVGSDSEGRPSPEAQRRKRLVRARGTGRSHSSSLDNLLSLTHNSQNSGSHQNSLQDLSLGQEGQESQSEGSSTETDVADENQNSDGQFDTAKRKKKKMRNLGAQSPRVVEESLEPSVSESQQKEEAEAAISEDDRVKTPQPEQFYSSPSNSISPADLAQNGPMNAAEICAARSKQQSRDSGFVGSFDDLLLSPKPSTDNGQSSESKNSAYHTKDYRSLDRNQLQERLGPSKLADVPLNNVSLSRKDSFNNWSSDEETNLMMSKMRQFFKTMVVNNNQNQTTSTPKSTASPAPSPRLSNYAAKTKNFTQNRTKPPQLVYFENELTRLMKTVPGIRDDQVREIVEYLSSEDTWSDSYDSSDYTSSDLESASGGKRSAIQEQISQSCQQIISKFEKESGTPVNAPAKRSSPTQSHNGVGRDTAFVYQKLVQSFTKITGDNVSSDNNSTPHSSPPLIAKVMHHIGSRLVALMHEVSESSSTHSHGSWRRWPQHRKPSSASTTEDDDSTSDSTSASKNAGIKQLPRSKSHDPLLLLNGQTTGTANTGQEAEEREASDYERFSWRGSFESALMAADSRTKLSLIASSIDTSAVAAKRRSAGDLLFNPKSLSREQLDRVRSCGSIGVNTAGPTAASSGSSIEKIWTNRRRSSVPDANTRGESAEEDSEDELEYTSVDSRAKTLPRDMQNVNNNTSQTTTNSLPRLQAQTSSNAHKSSIYHFLPQHNSVKSARYRPPGFTRSAAAAATAASGPKRALSAPGLQLVAPQNTLNKRENTRSRRQQQMSLPNDDGSSLSEACSTPIIGTSSRTSSNHAATMELEDIDRTLHASQLASRASLSSLGARSDSMASVYSGAGEGRWCGSVAVKGEVEFSLQYDYKQLTFEVHITQCRDLAPVDIKRNRSDPYVKVYLLPDKSKNGKRKTKVKKHTLNPVFDETLKFHMSLNGLESRILWLSVWHSDMFGRNDFLGEVRMPLENKIFDDPRPQWYPLQERTEPFDDPVAYKGEVIVGLKFVPPDPSQHERDRDSDRSHKSKKTWSKGALHVLVKEARNLQTRAKNSGTCDPFCKSYLLPDKGRSGKQKTSVIRRSSGSPAWNHTFVYKDISIQELAERGLELTVWDYDRIASNEFLGGVRFNLGTGKHYGKMVDWMDATGREMSLWQNMLERPNFWVEGSVTLRPNLHNHVKSGFT